MADVRIDYRGFPLTAPGAYVALVNALTNHERCQWNRMGSPGKKRQDAREVAKHFPQAVGRRSGFYVICIDPALPGSDVTVFYYHSDGRVEVAPAPA